MRTIWSWSRRSSTRSISASSTASAGVGGEVAGAAVLAGLEAGDLLVEAFDAPFTFVEAVLCSHEVVVGLAAFAPGSGAAFELGDLEAPVDDVACRFVSGCDERSEVGGAVPRCFVQHRLDSVAFGEQVGGAPRVDRCRGDAVEGELLVAAAFEAGGEDVERVVGVHRSGRGGRLRVAGRARPRSCGTCRCGSRCGRVTWLRRRARGRAGRRRASSWRRTWCRGPC